MLKLFASIDSRYLLRWIEGNRVKRSDKGFVHGVLHISFSELPICVRLNRIREITARVAAAIVKEAVKEDIAEGYRNTDIKELRRIVQDDVRFSSNLIFTW